MHGGGYIEDPHGSSEKVKTERQRETRGMGLVPITTKIFKELEVRPDDSIEFRGTLINEVSFVGHIIGFEEKEIKVILKIWDGSGSIEVNFNNRNENSERHPAISNLNFNENKKLVKIFGYVKFFRKEKQLIGNKLNFINYIEEQYHKMEVIHCWLDLEGKLEFIKNQQKAAYDEQVHNLSLNKGNNIMSHEIILQNSIKDMFKSRKDFSINEIVLKLTSRFSKDQIIENIYKLCEEGYFTETNGILTKI